MVRYGASVRWGDGTPQRDVARLDDCPWDPSRHRSGGNDRRGGSHLVGRRVALAVRPRARRPRRRSHAGTSRTTPRRSCRGALRVAGSCLPTHRARRRAGHWRRWHGRVRQGAPARHRGIHRRAPRGPPRCRRPRTAGAAGRSRRRAPRHVRATRRDAAGAIDVGRSTVADERRVRPRVRRFRRHRAAQRPSGAKPGVDGAGSCPDACRRRAGAGRAHRRSGTRLRCSVRARRQSVWPGHPRRPLRRPTGHRRQPDHRRARHRRCRSRRPHRRPSDGARVPNGEEPSTPTAAGSRLMRYAAHLRRGFHAHADESELDLATAAVVVGLATGPFRTQRADWRADVSHHLALARRLVETPDRAFT